jgi:hypothetical protein
MVHGGWVGRDLVLKLRTAKAQEAQHDACGDGDDTASMAKLPDTACGMMAQCMVVAGILSSARNGSHARASNDAS